MKKLAGNKVFDGQQLQYSHESQVLKCAMQFSIFLPPLACDESSDDSGASVPVLFWLSGLTCNDQNFVTKAGAQQMAAELGIAIVCPDTSPRGDNVPDDPDGAWDFGLGAGFYLNASQPPWSEHYHMYDYVVHELPELIAKNFAVDINRMSISGHSMGGHGALMIALRNPGRYKSVSAFAPIVSPLNCPWGEKAFSGYLGKSSSSEQTTWADYDTCTLVSRATERLPVLVDQGDADDFLADQLKTPLLEKAAAESGYPMQIRYQVGYDHSYFFIASFIQEHLEFHHRHLR